MGQGFPRIAERWLLGRTLEDKLAPASPETLDFGPPPCSIPAPGRPPGLEPARRGASFPADVRTDADRGRALHVFANHELQAIEVFAWALWRWPDAPAAFRRGLVAIVGEEQRHLRMYLARMRELGVELGVEPLSGFLWTSLVRCETPLQLVVGLGLGFEQANLDHAVVWAGRFAAIGDERSAALMRRVAEDEVGHVRHGVRWFEAWRDPAVDRKTAFVDAFVPPLTPARARGPVFAANLRERAGVPPEIVELVRGFSASKGRPPDVWWFNPGAEAHAEAGRDLGVEPAIVQEITGDLAPLLGFLAGPDDVVLVPEPPDPAFLASLAAKVPVPGFRDRRPDGPIRHLRPWAATPDAARIGPVPPTPRVLFARTALSAWLRDRWPEVDGWIGREDLAIPATADEVPAAVATLSGPVVVKADFSASGRNRRWLRAGEPWSGPRDRPPRGGAGFTVERWHERVADFSAQITVGDRIVLDGIGTFLTDDRGQYRGAVLGDPLAGLDTEVARFLAGRLEPWVRQAIELLDPWLRAVGFAGPAGIDAMVIRRDGRLALHPIVELNPRLTMGRVALALSRRVSRAAQWLHLPVSARPWLASLPPDRWDRGRLVEGRWYTTDPARARRIVTAVIAAPHAADLPVWPGAGPSR